MFIWKEIAEFVCKYAFSSYSPYFICEYNHLHSAATIAVNAQTTKSDLIHGSKVLEKAKDMGKLTPVFHILLIHVTKQ